MCVKGSVLRNNNLHALVQTLLPLPIPVISLHTHTQAHTTINPYTPTSISLKPCALAQPHVTLIQDQSEPKYHKQDTVTPAAPNNSQIIEERLQASRKDFNSHFLCLWKIVETTGDMLSGKRLDTSHVFLLIFLILT